jgi:hypothetical protein
MGELVEIMGLDGNFVELFGLDSLSNSGPTCEKVRQVSVIGEDRLGIPLLAPVIMPTGVRKYAMALSDACRYDDPAESLRCILEAIKQERPQREVTITAAEFASKVGDLRLSEAVLAAASNVLSPSDSDKVKKYVGYVRGEIEKNTKAQSVAGTWASIAALAGLAWLFGRHLFKGKRHVSRKRY